MPPPGLTPEERQEMRERSLREARAIARLNNVNVVRVFDVLRTDADPWIVMEYVPSRSLQDILAADGPFNPIRAAEIGLGVLGALRAAHRAGVVHRDVKPGNVLIGEDGRVVLTDFGLATVPGDPNVTRTGLVLGSPAYIAPERARDGTAGPGADLWSLGATLYAAVEGASPFARPSAIATLAALATENPPPARNAGPLKPVLNGLLRKDPSHRINAEEAERLLLRAAGRRSKLSFPMSPTMRRPGVGRERPPVVPGAAANAPVVPGPRPPATPPVTPGPVTPSRGTATPPGRAAATPPGHVATPPSRGSASAPQGRAAATPPAAENQQGRPIFAPGKASVGRAPRPAETRIDNPKTPLDATRLDSPAVDHTGTPKAKRTPPESGLDATMRGAGPALGSFTAAEVAAARKQPTPPQQPAPPQQPKAPQAAASAPALTPESTPTAITPIPSTGTPSAPDAVPDADTVLKAGPQATPDDAESVLVADAAPDNAAVKQDAAGPDAETATPPATEPAGDTETPGNIPSSEPAATAVRAGAGKASGKKVRGSQAASVAAVTSADLDTSSEAANATPDTVTGTGDKTLAGSDVEAEPTDSGTDAASEPGIADKADAAGEGGAEQQPTDGSGAEDNPSARTDRVAHEEPLVDNDLSARDKLGELGAQNKLAAQDRLGTQNDPGAENKVGAQDQLGAKDELGAQDQDGAQDRGGAQDRLGAQDQVDAKGQGGAQGGLGAEDKLGVGGEPGAEVLPGTPGKPGDRAVAEAGSEAADELGAEDGPTAVAPLRTTDEPTMVDASGAAGKADLASPADAASAVGMGSAATTASSSSAPSKAGNASDAANKAGVASNAGTVSEGGAAGKAGTANDGNPASKADVANDGNPASKAGAASQSDSASKAGAASQSDSTSKAGAASQSDSASKAGAASQGDSAGKGGAGIGFGASSGASAVAGASAAGSASAADRRDAAGEPTVVKPVDEFGGNRTRVLPQPSNLPSQASRASDDSVEGSKPPRRTAPVSGAPVSGAPVSGAPGMPSRPAWQPMMLREPSAGRRGVTVFGITFTRQQTVIGVGILAVVVLLLILVIPKAFGGDDDEKAAGGGGVAPVPTAAAVSPQKSGGASAPGGAAPTSAATSAPVAAPGTTPTSKAPTSAPASSSGTFTLPAGWKTYGNSGTGFTVPLPSDWSAEVRGDEIYFRGDNRLLIIAQTDQPKPDPLADWQQQEASRSNGTYKNYSRVKLQSVDYFQKAADWEFFYTTSSGNKQHAVKRNFLTSPKKAYSINWYVTPGDWAASQADLQNIYKGFKPQS
ncbi:hypothetical protein GCM10010435_18130 [Winogradskya consettensis]